MNQKELVENYLLKHKKIDTWTAFKRFGITRLSGVIFELRKKYNIRSEYKTKINRYGNSVTFCIYWLEGKL